MTDAELFKSYLKLFSPAEFPLMLAYDIQNPEPFDDDPIPLPLAEAFIAEEGENNDAFTEYVPVVQFRINKNYQACVVWKAGLGSYEFILIVYDNEGNIQETDDVAGTYYADMPMTYKVAEFSSPVKAVVVEGQISTDSIYETVKESQNFVLEISEIGEINYSIVRNK